MKRLFFVLGLLVSIGIFMPVSTLAQGINFSYEERTEIQWVVVVAYKTSRSSFRTTKRYTVYAYTSSEAESKARNIFEGDYPNYIFLSANASKK